MRKQDGIYLVIEFLGYFKMSKMIVYSCGVVLAAAQLYNNIRAVKTNSFSGNIWSGGGVGGWKLGKRVGSFYLKIV